MRLFRRRAVDALTEAPAHPATVVWRDASQRERHSHSKLCGGRVLWSTTSSGGYITWDAFLSFIGEHGRRTLTMKDT